ncbi:hypothetical protein [Bdellovibrio svalbardensis]|uniref:HEAT repeat domain-containing protein n=1 Tax=Bdellovibrio svalbardensis TaxID=2972972 RepID=A0ABT6DM27_9BACT|nr:hypothetical protein [Bdellovibrio svalbardensis]MDG0817942.1 hypothetical protein [Bdellovibrio svalbardensis]
MIRKFLLITALFFATSAGAAEYKSSEEILKDLAVYTSADSKKDEEHLASIVVKIDEAVQFSLKNKPSEQLLHEILRVSYITLKNDPTAAVADVLVPLYKKDEKAFKKALKTLPKSEGNALLKAIKQAIHEEDVGNG